VPGSGDAGHEREHVKKRLYIFWRTLVALWSTFPRPAKILVLLFALLAIVVIVLSSDPAFMALLCLGMLLLTLLSGVVIYRLLSREIK
jgi:hypothetical protein